MTTKKQLNKMQARLEAIRYIQERYSYYEDENGNIDVTQHPHLTQENLEAKEWAVETLLKNMDFSKASK